MRIAQHPGRGARAAALAASGASAVVRPPGCVRWVRRCRRNIRATSPSAMSRAPGASAGRSCSRAACLAARRGAAERGGAGAALDAARRRLAQHDLGAHGALGRGIRVAEREPQRAAPDAPRAARARVVSGGRDVAHGRDVVEAGDRDIDARASSPASRIAESAPTAMTSFAAKTSSMPSRPRSMQALHAVVAAVAGERGADRRRRRAVRRPVAARPARKPSTRSAAVRRPSPPVMTAKRR